MRRRRVRVGDRVVREKLVEFGLGDVIHADALRIVVSFDDGVLHYPAPIAVACLSIVEGSAS